MYCVGVCAVLILGPRAQHVCVETRMLKILDVLEILDDTRVLGVWLPTCLVVCRALSLSLSLFLALALSRLLSLNLCVCGPKGHTMHGGGGGRRDAWTYTCDRNGEITCNLITVMYQLADIGPGDGGLVCIRA